MWTWICARLFGSSSAIAELDDRKLQQVEAWRARLKTGDTLPIDDQRRIERLFNPTIRGAYNVAIDIAWRDAALTALRIEEDRLRVRLGREKKRRTKDLTEEGKE